MGQAVGWVKEDKRVDERNNENVPRWFVRIDRREKNRIAKIV